MGPQIVCVSSGKTKTIYEDFIQFQEKVLKTRTYDKHLRFKLCKDDAEIENFVNNYKPPSTSSNRLEFFKTWRRALELGTPVLDNPVYYTTRYISPESGVVLSGHGILNFGEEFASLNIEGPLKFCFCVQPSSYIVVDGDTLTFYLSFENSKTRSYGNEIKFDSSGDQKKVVNFFLGLLGPNNFLFV